MTIGTYGKISLADAGVKLAEAKKLLRQGRDKASAQERDKSSAQEPDKATEHDPGARLVAENKAEREPTRCLN
jgi:hypothetical protein